MRLLRRAGYTILLHSNPPMHRTTTGVLVYGKEIEINRFQLRAAS